MIRSRQAMAKDDQDYAGKTKYQSVITIRFERNTL